MDTAQNYKRVAQSLKSVVKDLEKMEKSGLHMETTRIKVKVPNTAYSSVQDSDQPSQKADRQKDCKAPVT